MEIRIQYCIVQASAWCLRRLLAADSNARRALLAGAARTLADMLGPPPPVERAPPPSAPTAAVEAMPQAALPGERVACFQVTMQSRCRICSMRACGACMQSFYCTSHGAASNLQRASLLSACCQKGTCTLARVLGRHGNLSRLCKSAGPVPTGEETAAPNGAVAPGGPPQLQPASAAAPPAGAPGDADAKLGARRTVMWSEMSNRPATPPTDPAAGTRPSQDATDSSSWFGALLPDPSGAFTAVSGSGSGMTCMRGVLAPKAGCSIRAGWTGRAQATREHAAGCLYWLARVEVIWPIDYHTH